MSYRAHMWRVVRRNTSGVTARDLASATGAQMQTAHGYINALLAANVVEIARTNADGTHRYRLIYDTGPVAPRYNDETGQLVLAPTVRYRIWQAIRVMRHYTITEVIAAAEATAPAVRNLSNDLLTAGYVRVTQPANRALAREARYALIRNSGPLPLVRRKRDGQLTDPNTNEVVYP